VILLSTEIEREAEEIRQAAARILFEGEQASIAEALIADALQFGPHGKLMSLVKIAERITKGEPIGAVMHGIELISRPVAELLHLPNTLTFVLRRIPKPAGA